MLTKQQSKLLEYLTSQDGPVAPSFDEMRVALGLRSKSGIHRLICALEARGYIRRIEHRARAIEVIRRPGEVPHSELEARIGDIARTGYRDREAYLRAFRALFSLARQNGIVIGNGRKEGDGAEPEAAATAI